MSNLLPLTSNRLNMMSLLRYERRMQRWIPRVFLRLSFVLTTLLLSACYQQGQLTPDAWDLTQRQLDSISFSTTHHYSQNYNFVVRGDSLQLIVQHPTEVVNGLPVDTFSVGHGVRLVVADITTMPTDSVDSV